MASDNDVQQKVLDLLAIIHRDGGQFTATWGLERSVRAAIAEVLRLKNILAKHNLLH